MKRRTVIKNLAVGAGAMSLANQSCAASTNNEAIEEVSLKGNIKHSVCRWCYNGVPLEELIDASKDMGIQSIEITKPAEWELIVKAGLTVSMGTADFISLTDGMNNPKNHEKVKEPYFRLIEKAADMGIKNLICFSGNRNGLDDEVGLENCAVGLDPIVKHAEKHGVLISMELLNSKVNHKDYQCDTTPWGAKLVDKIGSSNFKLLYDIYHMQIMEGDVIATIKKYQDYISHYHTGGVPGRNEIDETQELYYPAIIKAIVDTGYKEFLGQEFIPTWDDKMAALKHGVMTCDV
ncbi:MAG: TIM barrel protein [Bacteroidota bacterium]